MHKQRCCDIEIDEKGTSKDTENDKYEGIAGSFHIASQQYLVAIQNKTS
jgi:hypothetical protein